MARYIIYGTDKATKDARNRNQGLETVDDEEDLKVPAGTQTGTIVRIKSQGMPALGGRGKGDLFVAVTLITPKTLTKEQRKLLELAEVEDTEFSDESFIEKVRNIFG